MTRKRTRRSEAGRRSSPVSTPVSSSSSRRTEWSTDDCFRSQADSDAAWDTDSHRSENGVRRRSVEEGARSERSTGGSRVQKSLSLDNMDALSRPRPKGGRNASIESDSTSCAFTTGTQRNRGHSRGKNVQDVNESLVQQTKEHSDGDGTVKNSNRSCSRECFSERRHHTDAEPLKDREEHTGTSARNLKSGYCVAKVVEKVESTRRSLLISIPSTNASGDSVTFPTLAADSEHPPEPWASLLSDGGDVFSDTIYSWEGEDAHRNQVAERGRSPRSPGSTHEHHGRAHRDSTNPEKPSNSVPRREDSHVKEKESEVHKDDMWALSSRLLKHLYRERPRSKTWIPNTHNRAEASHAIRNDPRTPKREPSVPAVRYSQCANAGALPHPDLIHQPKGFVAPQQPSQGCAPIDGALRDSKNSTVVVTAPPATNMRDGLKPSHEPSEEQAQAGQLSCGCNQVTKPLNTPEEEDEVDWVNALGDLNLHLHIFFS